MAYYPMCKPNILRNRNQAELTIRVTYMEDSDTLEDEIFSFIFEEAWAPRS